MPFPAARVRRGGASGPPGQRETGTASRVACRPRCTRASRPGNELPPLAFPGVSSPRWRLRQACGPWTVLPCAEHHDAAIAPANRNASASATSRYACGAEACQQKRHRGDEIRARSRVRCASCGDDGRLVAERQRDARFVERLAPAASRRPRAMRRASTASGREHEGRPSQLASQCGAQGDVAEAARTGSLATEPRPRRAPHPRARSGTTLRSAAPT